MQHLPSLPVIVAVLAAALTSFSRVFDATRPGWGRLPAWFQTLAPTLLTAVGAIIAGLAHVASATDLTVVIVAGIMVALPGLPSNRSAAPLQAGKPATATPSAGDVAVASAMAVGSIRPKAPSVPPVVGLMLGCLLVLVLPGCGLIAAAVPVLAEAGVIIADATNAVSDAEELLPQLHLDATEEAKAETAIAKARKAIAAAAALDDGAKELTQAQLDASLADFRAAWADLQGAFASKRLGAGNESAAVALPVPLAVRRVQK